MNVMGRIHDELNLSGVSRKQAVVATNKHLMREAFKKGDAPSPISILAKSAEDAWEHFCNDFQTNAILKPSRNSGSRGIAKVERGISKEEFVRLYDIAIEEKSFTFTRLGYIGKLMRADVQLFCKDGSVTNRLIEHVNEIRVFKDILNFLG